MLKGREKQGNKKPEERILLSYGRFDGGKFSFHLFYAAPAETIKYRVNAYLTDIGMVAVGDAKGHMVGHYMRRGLASSKMGKWPPTATGGRLILPRASALTWVFPIHL